MLSALVTSILAFSAACAPRAYVLATDGPRLIALPTWVEPQKLILPWEGNGSSCPHVERKPDGALFVALHLDVGGSRTPYFCEVWVHQDASGRMTVAIDRTASGVSSLAECFAADSYADLAGQTTMSGDTLAELLAHAADGQPPRDAKFLAARLKTDRAPLSRDVRDNIALLDSPDWRTREAALARLAKPELLAQSREALAVLDLSAEAQRALEVVAVESSAGDALRDAVRRGH